MEIMERQLLHPRWIMCGSIVLDSVKEESEANSRQILDAVFAGSREVLDQKVKQGEWSSLALRVYDFVYDL